MARDLAAQLVLCQHVTQAPCGACGACRRVWTQQHPGPRLAPHRRGLAAIRIEQVRDLAADLALTSHAGGYKVGNRHAGRKRSTDLQPMPLLKTLEEPPARTLLVLVTTQPSRLPATVLRHACQRLRVRAPARAEGVAWLTGLRGGR